MKRGTENLEKSRTNLKILKMIKVFSFDAETNGLWGQAFSIAAVVQHENGKIETFLGRCPIQEEINDWVKENVLPQMENIPENYSSYEELLKAFIAFYLQHKDGADVIVHMGLPVEARVLIDAHSMGILGDWDAPYPLIDICAFPEIGTSVDSYNKEHGLDLFLPDVEGGTHNPLYDSYAALVAYDSLMMK